MEALIAVSGALVGITLSQVIGFQVKKGKPSGDDVSTQIDNRVAAIERVIPTLIPRDEVSQAISKVPPLVMQAVQEEMNAIGLKASRPSPMPSSSPIVSAPPQAPNAGPDPATMAAAKANEEKMKELNELLKKFNI